MKTKLLILAIVGLGLVSCSNDTVTDRTQSDLISFRPLLNSTTRTANSAGLKSAWETGDILYVYADYNGAMYFQDQFVKDGTGFNSATKHYWPSEITSTKAITFTSFWGAAQKAWTAPGDENQLAAQYVVDDAVANQMDLLFAKKTITAKPDDGAAVVLNFRHMLSQIAVKVANDQASLTIDVTGVRVGYVAKAGDFVYSGDVTDTNVDDATNSAAATMIARTDWTPVAATVATEMYDQDVTATLSGTTTATALTGFNSWILMPQQLTAATAYTDLTAGATTADPKLNGAYIALKMSIKDKDSNISIVDEQWCYWPINTEWKPGYKYTYTVNAGSGGYQGTDQNNTPGLDPVLSGLVIWFSPTCTIDTWVDEDEVNISDPVATGLYAKGSTNTINVAAGANGGFSFTITGLTPNNTVSLNDVNNSIASMSVDNATVPASGKVLVTGKLKANTAGAVTNSIVLTEKDGTPATVSTTTINIVQAAPATP